MENGNQNPTPPSIVDELQPILNRHGFDARCDTDDRSLAEWIVAQMNVLHELMIWRREHAEHGAGIAPIVEKKPGDQPKHEIQLPTIGVFPEIIECGPAIYDHRGTFQLGDGYFITERMMRDKADEHYPKSLNVALHDDMRQTFIDRIKSDPMNFFKLDELPRRVPVNNMPEQVNTDAEHPMIEEMKPLDGRAVIGYAANGQYRFNLMAWNNKIIAGSQGETYHNRRDVIDVIKKYFPNFAIVDTTGEGKDE